MRIRDYFSKPKGVREQKRPGNNVPSMYSGDKPFTSGLGFQDILTEGFCFFPQPIQTTAAIMP